MMLSGYCPSAALAEQVGKIARELKFNATMKPGSFFWVLDPVMGDNGRIYVAEDIVPVYKSLLKDADLILPNQFEAELLSDVKITDLTTMKQAIEKLHQTYQTPHVLITSIRLPPSASNTPLAVEEDFATSAKLSVIGSTRTSHMRSRLFRITIPALPIFFSGTGDMFASLMVSRLRQAASEANLLNTASWRSSDEVAAHDLPLAKAAEKVLASMHTVLKDTAAHYDGAAKTWQEDVHAGRVDSGRDSKDNELESQRHLVLTKAAEVRVVRNARALIDPPSLEDFKALSISADEWYEGHM
jgi:pyridoxine kinase